MKQLILLLLTLTITTNLFAKDNKVKEDKLLCKVFKDKLSTYKYTMRNDKYAKATVKSYEKRVIKYCK